MKVKPKSYVGCKGGRSIKGNSQKKGYRVNVKMATEEYYSPQNGISNRTKGNQSISIKTTQIYVRILDARISNDVMDLKSKEEIKIQLIRK